MSSCRIVRLTTYTGFPAYGHGTPSFTNATTWSKVLRPIMTTSTDARKSANPKSSFGSDGVGRKSSAPSGLARKPSMVKPTYTTVCRSAAPAPLAAAGMGASAVASDAPPARSAARRVAETETDSRDARAFDVRVFDARLWPANTRAAKSRADDDDIEPPGETT